MSIGVDDHDGIAVEQRTGCHLPLMWIVSRDEVRSIGIASRHTFIFDAGHPLGCRIDVRVMTHDARHRLSRGPRISAPNLAALPEQAGSRPSRPQHRSSLQSFVLMLKPPPLALWLYLGASVLVAIAGTLEIGGLAFRFQALPIAVWGGLVIAVIAGIRQARYALIAWQIITFIQVAIMSAGQGHSLGSIALMTLVTIQLALLFAPSFRMSSAA